MNSADCVRTAKSGNLGVKPGISKMYQEWNYSESSAGGSVNNSGRNSEIYSFGSGNSVNSGNNDLLNCVHHSIMNKKLIKNIQHKKGGIQKAKLIDMESPLKFNDDSEQIPSFEKTNIDILPMNDSQPHDLFP